MVRQAYWAAITGTLLAFALVSVGYLVGKREGRDERHCPCPCRRLLPLEQEPAPAPREIRELRHPRPDELA